MNRSPEPSRITDCCRRAESTSDFAAAIDDELATVAEHGPETQGVFYLSHGLYDVHLARWFDVVDRNNLQLVVFDDLMADPSRVSRELCRHIGAEDSDVPGIVGETVNPYVTFPVDPISPVNPATPRADRESRGQAQHETARTTAEMSPTTKAKLVDFYGSRIDVMESLTSLDLSRWKH